VTASWSGIISPTANDWIGLYKVGDPDSAFMTYQHTTGAASGSLSVPLPGSTSPGMYELRLFSNGTYTRLARSNPITVS
jgi:hypothetical protein